MDFNYNSYVPHAAWGARISGEGARALDDAAAVVSQPHGFFESHVLDENMFYAPLPPDMRDNRDIVLLWPPRDVREPRNMLTGDALRARREDSDIFMGAPAFGNRSRNNIVGSPASRSHNIFTASFRPQTAIQLDLSTIPDHWESALYDENDDSHSSSTASGWELDEEFVGLNYDEPSEVEEDAGSSPHASEPINNMNGTGLGPHGPENNNSIYGVPPALADYSDPEFMHIAAMAPNAVRDGVSYSGNVGEILTHKSWRRIIAGIPPGEPLPSEEQLNPAPEKMLAPAVDSEVDTEPSSPAQSEDEDDIYGATPPPVAIDDPNDSDFDLDQAEAETARDRALDNFDSDDNADDEDDDDDFVSRGRKRGPYRKRGPHCKAPGTARTGARKQGKKFQGRALEGSGTTLTSFRPGLFGFQNFGPRKGVADKRGLPNVQATREVHQGHPVDSSDKPQSSLNSRREGEQHDDDVTATSDKEDPASQSARIARIGEFIVDSPNYQASPECNEAKSQRLQRRVTDLRSALRSAEAGYEEAANNPHVKIDPRTKKRRQAKLEKIQAQLCEAEREQKLFDFRRGLDNETATTGSDTAASSPDVASAAAQPPLLQVLNEEVGELNDTIQRLHDRITHCEARVRAVEADPDKFANKRAGFKKGRITRLENARHSLSHHVQLLAHKQTLYDEEYKKVHGNDSMEGLNGEQMEQHKPGDNTQTTAADQLEPSLSQTSSSHKRKASEMVEGEEEQEEEEKSFPGRSKPRLMQGTPV